MKFRSLSWICGLAVIGEVLFLGCQPQGDRLPEEVSYNFHIRPILSDRCLKCHGPDAQQRKANLRLDLAESAYAALKDTPDAHALVPGQPAASAVFLRITSTDTAEVMPPPASNLALTAFEINLIEKWIRQGAKYEPHWAFTAPQKQTVPAGGKWGHNEIDWFVWRRMEERGLAPNPEASKEQLLKRVYFDLIGLPPTLEQQNTFLADVSDNAYEKVVDELLANRHYGEKLAIHWLDIARYADTHGYQDDGLRTMWPWRDWVIHAFNQNYSYDRFITWQLAGDLLPNPTPEMLLATGFNRNHKITQEGGVIDEEYRIEYVTDRTNTFGKAFLALTYECAKCHDHKYDPLSQRDYYRTFAFFNQVAEKGYQGDIYSGTAADPPRLKVTTEDVQKILQFINKKDSLPVQVMIMRDSSWKRPTHILKRGAYDALGDVVTAGTPESILPFDSTRLPRNRLGLAKWLTDPQHPLTSRVFVNRMWQEFFGRGLVKTTGDFGMQGELPSHPELLDWLAVDFVSHGWNVKRLVKQMVMSDTYRQSSHVRTSQRERDPENIYLSRAPRMRLPAELVRDAVLASSDLLVKEIGGPSVKPYQPKGIWEVATSGRGLTKYVQDHGHDLYRRGMYNFIKRTVPPPAMLIFDGSSRDQCEVSRLRTSTPLQSLVMMNDPQVLEAARVLAEKLMGTSLNDEEKIVTAFRKITCRKPQPEELRLLMQYWKDEATAFATNPTQAAEVISVGEYPHTEIASKSQLAAFIQVIMTIYNLDETITRI
jgi:hypothetical protein